MTLNIQAIGGQVRRAVEPYLEVKRVSHSFAGEGADRFVLHDISLCIAEREFVCLLGRSGCGKSTLLNILAGFLVPTVGRCLLGGKPITGPGPDRCVVFQEDALFPWLTLRENIAFGLKTSDFSRKERAREVDWVLGLVGLDGYGDFLPRQISGGMKQRAALARVLIRSPRILLMDEPFGALDAQSREASQELLQRIWRQRAQTILFVTHDVQEAMTLADRVLIMGGGREGIRGEMIVPLERPRDRASEAFQAYCGRFRHWLGQSPGSIGLDSKNCGARDLRPPVSCQFAYSGDESPK